MPDDVREWVDDILDEGESLAGFFFADILPDGSFGERWNVLTSERYLVLESHHDETGCTVPFETPLTRILRMKNFFILN